VTGPPHRQPAGGRSSRSDLTWKQRNGGSDIGRARIHAAQNQQRQGDEGSTARECVLRACPDRGEKKNDIGHRKGCCILNYTYMKITPFGFVQVRGAREHNLKNVDVDIPRNSSSCSVVCRALESHRWRSARSMRKRSDATLIVAPYARRLIDQVGVPAVDSIDGLPPAVALQQQRGGSGTRSSVGSVTHDLQSAADVVLASRELPPGQQMLYAEDFRPTLRRAPARAATEWPGVRGHGKDDDTR